MPWNRNMKYFGKCEKSPLLPLNRAMTCSFLLAKMNSSTRTTVSRISSIYL